MKIRTLNTGITAIILTTMALSGWSCGSEAPQTDTPKKEAVEYVTETLEIQDPTPAQKVLMDYLALKNDLVKTDATSAQNAAAALVESLGKVEGTYAGDALTDAEAIAETDDIVKQREHFDGLSQSIYGMMEDHKPIEGELYKQYCPMAFQNQGAFWLSTDAAIRNPYFGDKMLKCGVVKETL